MTNVCCACYQEKPIESFSISGKNQRRNKRCKICVLTYKQKYPPKQKLDAPNYSFLQLKGVVKEDYVMMYKLMLVMGFDVTKDIHQQFIDRHNLLVYKKRESRSITKYLYDGTFNPNYDR